MDSNYNKCKSVIGLGDKGFEKLLGLNLLIEAIFVKEKGRK
jgi:hypothetical protein